MAPSGEGITSPGRCPATPSVPQGRVRSSEPSRPAANAHQAIYEELLLDQEDLTIQVVGQTYTEPIHDLMLAAQGDRTRSETDLQTTKSRPAENGEPAWRTLRAYCAPVPLDEGWSKTAMVELLGCYSKWTSWADRLQSLDQTCGHRYESRPHARGIARRLSESEVTELITGYREGRTVYDLAERFHIHRTTVSQHLRRRGVKMRRLGLDEQQVNLAIRLYEQGWSVARIGSQCGVNGGTVWVALRGRDIQMRDTQGRGR
jgi:DNA-binding transcriptional ArsR family regulator